ncbi:hypothetical protein SARC_12319 [Sphaeroforma arctica JP610]|uniref:Cas1p 10 TM acyl transferase domain-containing protein n=1 Tax=Sphaeroforma arctica JP610 TaxID=667725 RepID=A0A0L0FEF9_9EUKA|nr:hypothetical protein SARC_12319 [Sphaeroforma arctica JP610]KNC75147.1 hypothetical protein SARC_12319 [Sphaeroforma arctica JP610]|eukprot:XP_014149049.1 hypothetical protein SARC_12319 [Sphaeroforma arctica JP610]
MPFWLVLVMDKPLMFYYFCPLISFWFFFVYFSMFIMSNRNASHPFMTKKFVCIFAFVLLFWVRFLPGDKSLFDLMFDYPSPLYYLIQENGSVAEWAFRSSLDKYAVPCGMLTAYVYIRLSSSGDIRDGSRNDNLFKSGTVNAVAAVGSVVLLGAYTMFATTCVDKKECNSWHTVASPLMIGSFVLLRNVYGPFRGVVSRFFCFMGKISLELFLLQCHVWLGSDTKGLLVIIPGAPVLNVVVTSLVFLYVSILMHDITGAIAGVLLPSNLEGRALYMRVGGFVALCVGLYLL